MNDVFKVFNEVTSSDMKHIVLSNDKDVILDKNKLMILNNKKILLREFLFPFGFFQIESILNTCNEIPGKIFYSKSHKLLVDREKIIISKIKNTKEIYLEISESLFEIDFPINLKFNISDDLDYIKSENKVSFDFDKIRFPIQIRQWRQGDYFYPIGMKGKKKLSDFFIDQKLIFH